MKNTKKSLILLSVLLVIILAGSAITAALLKYESNKITNTFVNGNVGCEIVEDITSTPGVKKNVMLKNTGTDSAYMRACVVVNWVDENGNIYNKAPVAGVDYTVVAPAPYGFVADGNMYYCTTVVEAGKTTPVLFTSIAPVAGKAPAGYVLSVEILGSAMQTAPVSAVENAWGVTVTEGVISK